MINISVLQNQKFNTVKEIMMKITAYMTFLLLMITIPFQAFAHEGGEAAQAEAGTGLLQYGLFLALAIFIITLIMSRISKKKLHSLSGKGKTEREQKQKLGQIKKVYQWLTIISGLFVVFIGFAMVAGNSNGENDGVTFQHIHGLGYSANGEEIYVPAHDGLRVYHGEHWAIPDAEKHDFMGFSMTDFGFYSSGHPEPESDMENPFGVVKSTDMGKTFETLDLYGEIDFHLMAVGYKSHAIYVFNPEKNSRMDEAGLYYTVDETKTWEKAAANGLAEAPTAIAVHHEKDNVVAAGTRNGLFLSKDNGETFDPLISNSPTTAVHFDAEGNIIAGTVTMDDNMMVKLQAVDGETGDTKELYFPELQEEDAISYIAVNPANVEEITVTTFKKDIYRTTNRGGDWQQIAENGVGVSEQE
jgi:preprotein translocase subunit SecG